MCENKQCLNIDKIILKILSLLIYNYKNIVYNYDIDISIIIDTEDGR